MQADHYRVISTSQEQEEQKKLITKVREPFIGNTIVFLSNEYLLTDVLVSDFYHDAIKIADIKKVENEQVGIIDENGRVLDSGEIAFIMNDSTRIVWNKTGSCDGRNIVAMVNYGIDAEEAEAEWIVRLANYDFGNGFKSNNIPIDIHTEDDYIKGMKYLASACAKSGYVFWESAEANLFLSAVMEWKITGNAKEVTWISKEYDENSFWHCVEFVREFRQSYLNKLWYFGDPEDKFEPLQDMKRQLLAYGELKIFKNFGVIKPAGFALTDKYFVILSDMNAIKLEEIRDIKIASKGQIMIKDATNEYLIKVAGALNLEEDDWNEFTKLQHILNIVILYAIRYGNNHFLTLEEQVEKKKGMEKTQETIEDFDEYMKKMGYALDSNFGTSIEEVQKLIDTIGGYLIHNDYYFPEPKRTVQELLSDMHNIANGNYSKIKVDFLTLLCGWSRRCELLEEEKIFDNLPDLCAEEYWTLVKGIIGILNNKKFTVLHLEHPDYNQERLLKALVKMDVNAKDVIVYTKIEKVFSVTGLALTETEAIDFDKKRKVRLVDVERIEVPSPCNCMRLYTRDSNIQLVVYDAEIISYEEGVKLLVAALKQYIKRLKAKEKIIVEVSKPPEENISKNISDSIFCPFCGNKISRAVKFCNFCGKPNNYGKEKQK